MQATGNSQKLRNHGLKISMQPGRALYAGFTIKIYGRFQSILPLYSLCSHRGLGDRGGRGIADHGPIS